MELLIPKIIDFSSELIIKTSRSGGSGGQHVNKVSTKVTIFFNLGKSNLLSPEQKIFLNYKLSNIINKSGDIIVYEDNSRSQLENKETAINRLNTLIHNALKKPKPRKPTKPSKTSVHKRLESKKIDGIKKMNRRRFDE